MICRSAVKPVVLGLGTAAVLAAGGTSALAATDSPSPSPSDSAGATPKPELVVDVVADDPSVTAGEYAAFTIRVAPSSGRATEVRVTDIAVSTDPKGAKLTFDGACPPPATASGCVLENVGTDGKAVTTLVRLAASDIDEPVSVTFEATVEGLFGEEAKDDGSDRATVTFKPQVKPSPTKPSSPAPAPTPTPTKPTKKPSPTKSSTPPPSSGGSGGSSGGGSGSGAGSGSGTGSGSGGSQVPPPPNSTFAPRDPEVALPTIQAPSPSVAPNPDPAAMAPQSRLRGNPAPVAQEVTFERMASTQAAWLAALLVAFSLLLTQLRLGRRRAPAPVKAKGAHRRPRRGVFGR